MGSLEGKMQGSEKLGFTDVPLQLHWRLSSPDKNVDCQRRPQGQAQLLGRLMPCINI